MSRRCKRHGTLVDTLEELEPAAELLVLGKRGEHCDFAKGHLGGQLQRVIRASVRPVLVAARAFKPVERFLIAYDGGPSVLKAVDFVLNNPLLKGLHCHILRAGKVDDNARYYLEETAQKLRDGRLHGHCRRRVWSAGAAHRQCGQILPD